MKRRELENALLVLETTPFVLQKVVVNADAALRRQIEGLIWEAAAIEEHVWSARIRLLRGERGAVLPKLDRGLARRIASGKTGARDAVAAFLRRRRENARALRTSTPADERLEHPVEGGGTFAFADLPGAMAEQDQCTLRELARRIAPTPSVPVPRDSERVPALCSF